MQPNCTFFFFFFLISTEYIKEKKIKNRKEKGDQAIRGKVKLVQLLKIGYLAEVDQEIDRKVRKHAINQR
jgi:hypothetical protein